MTKKTVQPKQPWQVWHQYPKPDDQRSGCKVSWYYYKDRAAAEACAAAAKHNAVIQESHGYDFGYCAPGSITQITKAYGGSDQMIGMFEVCLP
jgi:hypothetical protein